MVIGNFENTLISANDAYFEKNKKNLDLGEPACVKFCADFIDECFEDERPKED